MSGRGMGALGGPELAHRCLDHPPRAAGGAATALAQPAPTPPARGLAWGWRSRVGSASGSTAVGGRGWGPAGAAPGTSSGECVSGRLGGSGSTWQSLRTMGCGGFGKREARQAALGTAGA